MNKHLITCFVATCVVIATAGTAVAQQNQATTSANASASMVTAIGIQKTTDLNFGTVVAGGTSGTVLVTSAGTRSATGGATLGTGGAVTQAVFNVTGEGSATYAITLPSSATLTSGVNNMVVDNFTSNPSTAGQLSAGGSEALNVGATLQVNASQANGNYTGSFNVTVNYN